VAFNASERANRNPEVFDYRVAEEERLREQFAAQSQPGFKLGPAFSDAAYRAVRDRDSGLLDEEGKVTYARGVPNRSSSRFAGENQEVIALLGMDRGRTFFGATNSKDATAYKTLGNWAEQALAAEQTGMVPV